MLGKGQRIGNGCSHLFGHLHCEERQPKHNGPAKRTRLHGQFDPLALLSPSRACGFGRLQPRLEPRFYHGRCNAFLIYSRRIKAHGHLLGRQVDVSHFDAGQARHLLLDLPHAASAVHALNGKMLLSIVCHVATSQFDRRTRSMRWFSTPARC